MEEVKEQQAIQRLRDAGFILRASPENSSGTTRFYFIDKPRGTGGNRRFGNGRVRPISIGDEDIEEILLDLSKGAIFNNPSEPDTWRFGAEIMKFKGEPDDPGYFAKTYPDINQAVDAALKYYFGSPMWMNSPNVFAADLREYSWHPVLDWFREHWKRERIVEKEVEFRDLFSFVFWRATLDRPIISLRRLYYRFRYTDPYPYYLYNDFVRPSYGFRHYGAHGEKLKRRLLCMTVAVAVRKNEPVIGEQAPDNQA